MGHAATAPGDYLGPLDGCSILKLRTCLHQLLVRLFPSQNGHALWVTNPSEKGSGLCHLTVCLERSWQVGVVIMSPHEDMAGGRLQSNAWHQVVSEILKREGR